VHFERQAGQHDSRTGKRTGVRWQIVPLRGVAVAALRKTASPDIWSLPSDAETLLPTLRDAQRSASLVLIDLEGSANQAMLYACGKSDLVLIPAQPSAFDVREARKTADVVSQAADLVGREIGLRVVLTRTRCFVSVLRSIAAPSLKRLVCLCCQSSWCSAPPFRP
jgi:hypothetical protein